jgi:carboxyl-terminal processing protease
MRTIHKIGIGVLVGLFFASGYATRIHCATRQHAVALTPADASAEGTRVASARLTDVANVDIRPLETLYSVLRNLREHYVEQLTVEEEGKMTYDAMRSMLASLNDPDTRFVEPAQRKLMADAEQGKFHGIGAIMAIKQTWKEDKQKPKEPISEEHLVVATVLPDGPAAKAGLKPGDEIIAINGKDVLPFNPYQRVNDMMKDDKIRDMERSKLLKMLDAEQKRIDGGVGVIEAERLLMNDDKKPIELMLAATAPAKPAKMTIQPADVTVDPVSAVRMEDGDMGYVRVGFFGTGTAGKFAGAMKELKAKDAKGLIVDLRGATGGNVESAEKIAGWFAPQRVMAILLRSRGRKDTIRTSATEGDTWNKPVVLLVDHSTTRAPEVLAAALKDTGIAKLVGEKTFGDFSDSTLIDLADGSAVVIATGKYVTSKGVDYNRKGLPVDVQASTSDQQLKEAIKLLTGSGGRS